MRYAVRTLWWTAATLRIRAFWQQIAAVAAVGWPFSLLTCVLVLVCVLAGCHPNKQPHETSSSWWTRHAATTESAAHPMQNAPSSSSASAAGPLLEKPSRELAESQYAEAWHAIYQDYMDGNFNGQDWMRWKRRYVGLLTDEEDAQVAIGTMLASLNDQYTRFLSAQEFREQSISIDSHLVGVGMQIAVRNNRLVVVAPLDDTPAQRAGLKPNDVITHIDDAPTAGLDVEEAAERIRGPEGTTVRLTIARPLLPATTTHQARAAAKQAHNNNNNNNKVGDSPEHFQEPFTLEVERADIQLKSVFTEPIPQAPDIGYIRLNSFLSELATQEMRQALQDLSDKKALVLDLRGNYGGLFSNALDIADLFSAKRLVVTVQGRKSSDSSQFYTYPDVVFGGPLAVLVDGGTASASEILSGFLKDNHRATLIGTRTFGKGLVQKIVHLPGGAGVNVTIARYLTPKGTDINHKGIDPDQTVTLPPAASSPDETVPSLANDPQLQAAVKHLRQQLVRSATARASQRSSGSAVESRPNKASSPHVPTVR